MRAASQNFMLLACSFYLFSASPARADNEHQGMEEPLLSSVRRSIVKINAVRQNLDFLNPWLFSASQSVSGSGFYVGKRRLISNAHVVSNARFITVQKDGDSRQYSAYVEFIAHDSDLAILNVEDKEFFTGLHPLSLGGVPRLRSPVSTVGYPAGGEQIAVTKGIISRIDYSLYVHTDYHYHLLIQVDSAINPGASGGPVLQNGKVVGVAFQAFRSAQNIGYIIPVPVIKRFLNAIASGTYHGHPETGLVGRAWVTDNAAASRFYGVREGFQLTELAPWSSFKGYLQEGDIVLEIDRQKIGPDGNIPYYGERVSFYAFLDLKQIGEEVQFKLKRGEKILTVRVKIQSPREHPFRGLTYKKRPRYLVVGGLVFTELSQSYLETWGEDWPRRLPFLLRYVFSHSDEDEVLSQNKSFVVLARRLPHEINEYAEGFQNNIVQKINGKSIHSFENFQEELQKLSTKFLQLEFFGREDSLYLPVQGIKNSHLQIKETYGIEPDGWFDTETDGAINWKERGL